MKCWWLPCGGVVQVVASPRGSCKLHPQGQRWQPICRDQTEPTVKHKHRCFSLINTSFPPVNGCSSLKSIFDSSMIWPPKAVYGKLLYQWHGRDSVKIELVTSFHQRTCFLFFFSFIKGKVITNPSPCSLVSVAHLQATMCETISKWNHKGAAVPDGRLSAVWSCYIKTARCIPPFKSETNSYKVGADVDRLITTAESLWEKPISPVGS